jgi:hypothetical protein
MTLYIGIDLGKDGALAALNADGTILALHKTPLLKASTKKGKKQGRDEYDIPAMGEILVELVPHGDAIAIVEKAQAFPPKFGGSLASFAKGYSAGLWHGFLTALGIPFEVVSPQTWQKVMFRDVPGEDTKLKSILVARRLWPGQDFRRSEQAKKPDDGITDALLLGEFGRRRRHGK